MIESDRLFIGVTTFIDEYRIMSHWNSNEELRNCIHASMHIPYYCTHIEKTRVNHESRRAIDGGFGKTYQRFNEKTLVVTALSDDGDIVSNPPLHFLKDCYKPNLQRYYKMRNNGYSAMMQWNGKYKTNKYKQPPFMLKKLVVFIFWIARIMEEIQIKRLFFILTPLALYRQYRKHKMIKTH